MKFADLVWVMAAACLVGQVVLVEAEDCTLPELGDVARQSTLSDVVQMLEAVWNAIAWPNIETPSLLSSPVYMLTHKCIPLLVQQHVNGADVFNRSWEEFKVGFNDSIGNFWLGNEMLHQLTKNGRYKLKVDLRPRQMFSYLWHWAEYETFMVASEASKYMMHISGYAGRWADALMQHNGGRFSTYDSDNDGNPEENCALTMGGGFWWNDDCMRRFSGVNTPLGSRANFRWFHTSVNYRLSVSRMWLTC